MEALSINEIIKAVGGDFNNRGGTRVRVSGVSTDTRTIRPGELYVPLRGENFDGHGFLEAAVRKGASAVLCDKGRSFDPGHESTSVVYVNDTGKALLDLSGYYRRKFSPTLVGITGSNGKTTTKDLLGTALASSAARPASSAARPASSAARLASSAAGPASSAAGPASSAETVVSVRSYNNFVGVPLTLFRIETGTRYAVLEIGTNSPGEIRALARAARPTMGIVTNIGSAHLEGLGDLDGVAVEKADLLHSLKEDGIAILNRDDPFFAYLSAEAPGPVVSFGMNSAADYAAEMIEEEDGFMAFRVNGVHIRLQLMGVHNVMNALAAFACAAELGVDPERAAEAFVQFPGTPMRLQPLRTQSLFILNDAYNANPASMATALETFSRHRAEGRKVVVLGDMLELGSESARLHREIGEALGRHGFDLVAAVGRWADRILEGIGMSCPSPGSCFSYSDTKEAVEAFPEMLEINDSILVKGSRRVGLEELVDLLVSLDLASNRERIS